MKKLILILLLATTLYPQSSNLLLLMSGGYKNPETTLYLAGQTVSGEQATRIDNFVTMLKDSLGITSLSSKFDVMYLLANQNQALGLRNLVKRSHDATAVNSPTFTQWQGFAGNGTSSYLNTNFKESQGINYNISNYNIMMGAYLRSGSYGSLAIMGARGSKYSLIYNLSIAGISYYGNVTSPITSSIANVSYPKMQSAGRENNTQATVSTKNSTLNHYTTNTLNFEGSADNNFYIFAYNNNGTPAAYSDAQASFVYFSRFLTSVEIRKIFNCFKYYMDSLN